MKHLWGINAADIDLGYRNLRDAHGPTERQMRDAIDQMWNSYHPYADRRFHSGFARDPEGHFWEMYIGVELLKAGKTLLRTSERSRKGGQPDICVLDGKRRVWIEAIVPDRGTESPDQVRGPKPINEGGGLEPSPIRKVELRLTSALLTKRRIIERYLQEGVIRPEDIRLIAIGTGRFSLYVSESPLPAILKAVFPIGDEFAVVNRTTGDVVNHGYHYSSEIQRQRAPISRTAFLDDQYASLSGILWSRISIGNMSRVQRPLTLVHNPLAAVPLPVRWCSWDREFLTTREGNDWVATDILASNVEDAAHA